MKRSEKMEKQIEIKKSRKQVNLYNRLYEFIKAKFKKDNDFKDLARLTTGQFIEYPQKDFTKARVKVNDSEIIVPIVCLPPSTLKFEKGEYLLLIYWDSIETARVLGRYENQLASKVMTGGTV